MGLMDAIQLQTREKASNSKFTEARRLAECHELFDDVCLLATIVPLWQHQSTTVLTGNASNPALRVAGVPTCPR